METATTRDTSAPERPAEDVGEPAPVGARSERHPDDGSRRSGDRVERLGPVALFAAAAGGYLLVSLVLWSGVWLHHPTSTTTCGCGDASLFTWFLEWPAYAITHGLNPLYSGAMFHPAGVNMVANTGVVAIGVALAPVTWVFGPVATLNAASTLAPVLSALAMFALVRRWVDWKPAAFLAGLFYGFSPFVLVSLTVAHLMLAMAVVPPLVVGCLDELLLRHRRRPVRVGVLLGLLVALQFFIGTEVLLIMATIAGITVAGLVVVGLLRPWRLRWHARRAAPGLAAAGVTAGVLVAYPLWFALAGPAHLSGPIWPTGLSHQGGTLQAVSLPTPSTHGWLVWTRVVGQFQGQLLSDQYIGLGVLVVAAAGCLIWRRDRRLWLFAAVAVVSLALDLGVKKGEVLPWQAVAGLPLFQNVVPSRFVLGALVALAVMLGLVLDHAHTNVNARVGAPGRPRTRWPPRWSGERIPVGSRWPGRAAALLLAAVALLPVAWYLRAITPVATRPVTVPNWFLTVGRRLSGPQVLLVLPAPSVREAPLTWQAIDRMHYVVAMGSGPADDVSRAGTSARGESVLYNASTAVHPQTFEAGDTTAVRRVLAGWGVTTVVLPDQPDLPIYEQVTSVPFAVALVTAATGQAPVHEGSAWVWYRLDRDRAPSVPVTARLRACTDDAISTSASTGQLVSCVLGGARRARAPAP